MISWKDVLVQQERYADLRREADRDRFAQKALAQQSRSSRIYIRVLHRLQSLFASLRPAPSMPPPQETSSGARPTQFEHRRRAHGQANGELHG